MNNISGIKKLGLIIMFTNWRLKYVMVLSMVHTHTSLILSYCAGMLRIVSVFDAGAASHSSCDILSLTKTDMA